MIRFKAGLFRSTVPQKPATEDHKDLRATIETTLTENLSKYDDTESAVRASLEAIINATKITIVSEVAEKIVSNILEDL